MSWTRGKRCHKCLRKINEENPASTVDDRGNECCDTCTVCEHGVPLIIPKCSGCEKIVADLLGATNVLS